MRFLKPTKSKLTLLVFLFLLTAFIPQYQYNCWVDQTGAESYNCGFIPANGIGYPIYYGERYSDDIITRGFHPFLFVYNLVIYYLLSCLIVYFYSKYKK